MAGEDVLGMGRGRGSCARLGRRFFLWRVNYSNIRSSQKAYESTSKVGLRSGSNKNILDLEGIDIRISNSANVDS